MIFVLDLNDARVGEPSKLATHSGNRTTAIMTASAIFAEFEQGSLLRSLVTQRDHWIHPHRATGWDIAGQQRHDRESDGNG